MKKILNAKAKDDTKPIEINYVVDNTKVTGNNKMMDINKILEAIKEVCYVVFNKQLCISVGASQAMRGEVKKFFSFENEK